MAAALGIELHPEPLVGDRVADSGLEEPLAIGADDDQRQVHHAAVERDRLIVVVDVPELLQFGDHGEVVVRHQAADVGQLVPEVAQQVQAIVVGGRVARIGFPGVAGDDLVHVGDIEGAVVGQVEMAFAVRVVPQLAADGQHGVEVLERLLPVRGPHLAPPDVERFLLDLLRRRSARPARAGGRGAPPWRRRRTTDSRRPRSGAGSWDCALDRGWLLDDARNWLPQA